MKIFFLGIVLTGLALAHESVLKRPQSFNTSEGAAVFVDFKTADYEVIYDITNKKSLVTAKIKFFMPEPGLPIFDSYETPASITLNGETVTAVETMTPGSETTVRIINKKLQVGNYTTVITVPLTSLVEYKDGGVKSAFWTSDLTERKFLERYIPANLEYDQVKMTFKINFVGAKAKQRIYTNGIVNSMNETTFGVVYPAHFNASSIFFHTVPDGTTNETSYTLKSVDGREIPVVIYVANSLFGTGNTLNKLKALTNEIFHELEGDYGPWPHPSLLIYNAGSGGMEYAGATMTSVTALGHELFHSYFARGIMPANGNAGWLDEALASWRDEGYKTSSNLLGSSRMSAHPYYTRTTDRAAYTFGERFMRYMDGKLKAKGGLKPFMRYMVEKKIFSPIYVEDFIKEMSSFYGESVEADFRKYTFGTKDNFDFSSEKHNHSIHRKMELSELQNYL